ncbi:MAG: TetR/AcrR family transcriptional regulator [Acetobacteraceae bacterium]|nr:TetR/AcrR family transcriptional regulator [Acetobacteraceae bacterium]
MSASVPGVPTRTRILEAAIACFDRSGFHGASMGAICAEAGMSPGALYRYFPSKDAIIAAIVEADRERHAGFFSRLAEADDPVEALATIGIEMMDEMFAEGGTMLAVEVTAESRRNEAIRAVVRARADQCRTAISDALTRGQERGLVDPALVAGEAAQIIMAIADGLFAQKAQDPTLTADRLRDTLRTLLGRFLRPVGR